MGEVAVVEKKELTEAEKAFSKIENPKSIQDYFINNLLIAADKIDKDYNGTVGQRDTLVGTLKEQSYYSKTNNGFAFFGDNANNTFERGLAEKGSDAAKHVFDNSRIKLLSEIHNFPVDKKVAAEFTAIVKTSFHSAIDSRAEQLGLVAAKAPVAATEVVNTQEKELAGAGVNSK